MRKRGYAAHIAHGLRLPQTATHKVVRVVVALLAPERELAADTAAVRHTGLLGLLEGLGSELAGDQELVRGADVDEDVERARLRLGRGEEEGGVVRQPLGGGKRAGTRLEVCGERADAPGDAGGVAGESAEHECRRRGQLGVAASR